MSPPSEAILLFVKPITNVLTDLSVVLFRSAYLFNGIDREHHARKHKFLQNNIEVFERTENRKTVWWFRMAAAHTLCNSR